MNLKSTVVEQGGFMGPIDEKNESFFPLKEDNSTNSESKSSLEEVIRDVFTENIAPHL